MARSPPPKSSRYVPHMISEIEDNDLSDKNEDGASNSSADGNNGNSNEGNGDDIMELSADDSSRHSRDGGSAEEGGEQSDRLLPLQRDSSWYFQSSGQPPAAQQPGGLPPHLAYWHDGSMGVSELTLRQESSMKELDPDSAAAAGGSEQDLLEEDEFTVYGSRWIMLAYMSLLNLISDWTCYSIAPIALLTVEAFGDVDPESLVTVFLGANAVASAAEPAILGRLGLRRTVLFGSFLQMIGSIVKSGGFASLAGRSKLMPGEEDITWRLYLGFFLVGLSQPLYQCTPALLSASWFPNNERTMATGVALNSNQLGIGFAFVFGTVLVATQEDIIPYFGLLSIVATLTFIGTALQFDDAPPTPPSDTARVIKGTLQIKLPFLKRFGKDKSVRTLTAQGMQSPAQANNNKKEGNKGATEPSEGALNIRGGGPPPPTIEEEPSGSGEGLEAIPPEQPPSHAQPGHPLQQGVPYPVSFYPNEFYHGYDAEGHYHNSFLDTRNMYTDDIYDDFGGEDEGAEPILTQLDHQLDIDIRDDQIVQQFKACFRRKGFVHCVVAFTTSGIIVNTLSTFMDYLVTLNGAGRGYVGIVGGLFQLLIMIASLIFGAWTDHSRKYYFIILAMLIFGAFALAVCNVDLDANAGGDLRVMLLVVGILAGPLQPLSTELGVEVVYPLSENTVLVIQQLFSNLLSAAFIPVFKALRNVGHNAAGDNKDSMWELPQYTFSFYLLICIHAVSTVYFATFNGTYLRHEAELEKKAIKEAKREKLLAARRQTSGQQQGGYGSIEHN